VAGLDIADRLHGRLAAAVQRAGRPHRRAARRAPGGRRLRRAGRVARTAGYRLLRPHARPQQHHRAREERPGARSHLGRGR
jgi:hypothetical protein